MSSKRTQGRRLALQILYALDMGGQESPSFEDQIGLAAPRVSPEVRSYAEYLYQGVIQLKGELDEALEQHLKHWKIERIHPLERNILRLGIFELNYCPDVPANIAINEAVSLAHHFGDDDAWRLINGILDQVGKVRLDVEGKDYPTSVDAE
jgi:N utilization substance protein B